jgi:acetyl-CoA acetyltransferase family protein
MVQAARALTLGDARLVIAGGVEGMSRAPFVLPKPDESLPRQLALHQTTVGWRMVNPRFPDTWTRSLGECAEWVARDYGIGREDQDAWAVRSHSRATAAWDAGRHDDYVVEVEGVHRDESIRPDTNAAVLAALQPAFTEQGEVTAGNSAPLNDGAIAVLMGTQAAAADLGVEPIGRIVASAVSALEPDRFALAPVPAIGRALERAGKTLDDMAVVEINEAFAAMVLSCLHDLPGLDRDRVNPNGGALAYGHPLGASMPRIVVDLCRELRRRGGGFGLATCCIGVGQGLAVVCEV